MEKTQLIEVQNRSAGMVIYKIPEDNIRRTFSPGEVKKVPLGELEKLTFQEGGKTLIANYLLLKDPQATEDLNVPTEKEYWFSEAEVINLLQNGTLDEFLDALDFAPQGVIDLIKDLAIKLPLTDYNKMDAMKKKLGFDVSKAISNNRADAEEDEVAAGATPQRRVQSQVTETPVRRTESKYNIVTK